jgi:hypothetical protein
VTHRHRRRVGDRQRYALSTSAYCAPANQVRSGSGPTQRFPWFASCIWMNSRFDGSQVTELPGARPRVMTSRTLRRSASRNGFDGIGKNVQRTGGAA